MIKPKHCTEDRMIEPVGATKRRSHINGPPNQLEFYILGVCFVSAMKFGLLHPVAVHQGRHQRHCWFPGNSCGGIHDYHPPYFATASRMRCQYNARPGKVVTPVKTASA